jgi:hypothetical protein
MKNQYTSLEHSIRNIMESRSIDVEQAKTLEQSIIEGGHTLEEKVGPRPPNANNKPESTSSGVGDVVTDLALDMTPIVGTYREGGRAVDAFKKGEILKGLGHSALTALSGAADIATITGIGAAAGPALRGSIAASRAAKALDAASDVAKAAETVADVAKVGKVAGATKAADTASDAALIKRITSGKKKGSDTPPPANAPETQGNLALKPQEFKPSTTKTDGKIDVQKPANDPGAPGTTNVTSLPPRTTRVPPANPNTRVETPGQAPANLNVPTYKPSAPTTTVKPKAADNLTTAPSAAVTGTSTRATAAAADTVTDVDRATDAVTNADKVADAAAALKNAANRRAVSSGRARSRGRTGRGVAARGLGRLRLSLPSIKTAFDSQSAAGQASGVGTYMHKAGAPLKVSEENEADKARTSIENVARVNSRRDKAVKQQEIQKKILDEKRSLADTVKRNVEETRTKQKTESPIITNPELKRPEPEGINNVR